MGETLQIRLPFRMGRILLPERLDRKKANSRIIACFFAKERIYADQIF